MGFFDRVRETLRDRTRENFCDGLQRLGIHAQMAERGCAEENIGLMLPCNVIVYEKADRTAISIIRPTVAMGMIENDELRAIAAEVEAKLAKVFKSIQ